MSILIYYLILFALVVLFNSFKVIKLESYIFEEKKYKNYFLFSQELVLTSSGIIFLLTEKIHDTYTVLAIFFVYLFFVASSSLINTLPNKYKEFLYYSNIFIILVIIAGVLYIFINVIPDINQINQTFQNKDCNKKDTIITYKIAIPYKDNSLIKHIGKENFGNRQFAVFSSIIAKNKRSAVDSIKKTIFEDASVRPLFPFIKGIEYKTDFDFEKMIIERNVSIKNEDIE